MLQNVDGRFIGEVLEENISSPTSPDKSVCDAVFSRSNGGKDSVETSVDEKPSGILFVITSSFSRARDCNKTYSFSDNDNKSLSNKTYFIDDDNKIHERNTGFIDDVKKYFSKSLRQ